MPGLEPGIHDFFSTKTWMAGTSPAMILFYAERTQIGYRDRQCVIGVQAPRSAA
jgi:hypothetical protein